MAEGCLKCGGTGRHVSGVPCRHCEGSGLSTPSSPSFPPTAESQIGEAWLAVSKAMPRHEGEAARWLEGELAKRGFVIVKAPSGDRVEAVADGIAEADNRMLPSVQYKKFARAAVTALEAHREVAPPKWVEANASQKHRIRELEAQGNVLATALKGVAGDRADELLRQWDAILASSPEGRRDG